MGITPPSLRTSGATSCRVGGGPSALRWAQPVGVAPTGMTRLLARVACVVKRKNAICCGIQPSSNNILTQKELPAQALPDTRAGVCETWRDCHHFVVAGKRSFPTTGSGDMNAKLKYGLSHDDVTICGN